MLSDGVPILHGTEGGPPICSKILPMTPRKFKGVEGASAGSSVRRDRSRSYRVTSKILALLGFGAGDVPTSLLAGIATIYTEEARSLVMACSQAKIDLKDPVAHHDASLGLLF